MDDEARLLAEVEDEARLLAEVEDEARRIVDRLTSIALDRVAPVCEHVRAAAQAIVDLTKPLDDSVPAAATVPAVGPAAAGWQVAVVVRDFVRAARAASVAGGAMTATPLARARETLVHLRRELP